VGPDGRIIPGGKLGAKVTEVVDASPAETAGIRQGDTIIGIDGTLVDTPTRLTAITGRHQPGDRLNFEWITQVGQHRSGVVTVVPGPPA
jgi:S1-C subfamily serine protease